MVVTITVVLQEALTIEAIVVVTITVVLQEALTTEDMVVEVAIVEVVEVAIAVAEGEVTIINI
jgi:hypothetical protein